MNQPAKSYYRVMLGRQSVHAAECFAGGFIGADYEIHQDLSGQLLEEWRQFNAAFIPVFLAGHPGKSKIAAGLACGALWTVAKGIRTAGMWCSARMAPASTTLARCKAATTTPPARCCRTAAR